MHHSEIPFNPDADLTSREEAERLNALLGEFAGIGATGRFPEGKLTHSDEGEIRFAVSHAQGKVLIHFGKPVAWLGLGRHHVVALIKILQKHADEL